MYATAETREKAFTSKVFVPVFNKVVWYVPVIYDEVDNPKRDRHQIIIVDETRRSVQDFQCLLNMVYRDTDNNSLYVVVKVSTYDCCICNQIFNGKTLATPDSTAIHVVDVESMVQKYHTDTGTQIFTDNGVLSIIPGHDNDDDNNNVDNNKDDDNNNVDNNDDDNADNQHDSGV